MRLDLTPAKLGSLQRWNSRQTTETVRFAPEERQPSQPRYLFFQYKRHPEVNANQFRRHIPQLFRLVFPIFRLSVTR